MKDIRLAVIYTKISFEDIYAELGVANISFDFEEKCVDSAELLGIDKCDCKDYSLVEDVCGCI